MRRDVRRLKPQLDAGASLETHSAAEPGLQGGDHRGFTLVELLVALSIASVVVIVAHQLFAAVAEHGKTLTAARTSLDRRANARRWLKGAFLSLDVGTDGASGFEGRPDHVAFSTWLLTPDGWFERRAVSLARNDDRLVANVTPGQPIALMDSATDVELDYLLEPGAESRWVREWVSPVSAPLTVRLRIARTGCGMQDAGCVVDTLLFLIKERG
jgi:prepilin-type N-terminal cleavage/methylation domain-containing protein